MTAADFEARLCPTWLNEIKKTKLYNYTKPAAGINFLLCAGANDSNLHEPHGLEGFGIAAGRAACKLVWRIDELKLLLQ